MADRHSSLRPLRSSINLLNNKSINQKNLRNNQISTELSKDQITKISPTENDDNSKSKIDLNRTSNRRGSKLANLTNTSINTSFNSTFNSTFNSSLNKSSTKLNINSIKIKKLNQSIEKKKIKKAIKTVLNKEQRIKKWLITKETIDDYDYWRLYSERLGKELEDTLNNLDELELENELLIAEFEEMNKLATNAYKLNKLLKSLDIQKIIENKKN